MQELLTVVQALGGEAAVAVVCWWFLRAVLNDERTDQIEERKLMLASNEKINDRLAKSIDRLTDKLG